MGAYRVGQAAGLILSIDLLRNYFLLQSPDFGCGFVKIIQRLAQNLKISETGDPALRDSRVLRRK